MFLGLLWLLPLAVTFPQSVLQVRVVSFFVARAVQDESTRTFRLKPLCPWIIPGTDISPQAAFSLHRHPSCAFLTVLCDPVSFIGESSPDRQAFSWGSMTPEVFTSCVSLWCVCIVFLIERMKRASEPLVLRPDCQPGLPLLIADALVPLWTPGAVLPSPGLSWTPGLMPSWPGPPLTAAGCRFHLSSEKSSVTVGAGEQLCTLRLQRGHLPPLPTGHSSGLVADTSATHSCSPVRSALQDCPPSPNSESPQLK